ncbi:solute carrier family 23 protein [Nocardioides perillae]|uniref:AGZA family xanthine/uracil permease-like MFS transporter n=1 Tax=Nocardioides perillae TaxID=1119534 RepID=A0A7Y9RQW1_9ACTN|nr:AGZA family xanthine/uracil permease-like MFS transporter [Nocardioides perillae]
MSDSAKTASGGTTTPGPRPSGLDRFFSITARGSTVAQEVRGGVVTFLTMAYIIVLNPLILGFVPDSTGAFLGGGPGDGSNLPAIAAATALVAGVLTILMGAVANFPLALATGLGLNAFVAVAIATQATWADAMGLVVLEGIVILVLVLTGFRTAVFHAVPTQLKVAISVGIGLFIALIGFVDAGFVSRIPDAAQTTVPVQLGSGGQLSGWPVLVFAGGLVLLVALWVRHVKGAILITIAVATVVAGILEAALDIGPRSADNPGGWILAAPTLDRFVDVPDFGTLGEFSLFGAFSSIGVVAALLLVFSLLLADFFDTMGTMTAIGAEAGLNDEEGVPPRTQRILVVDSIAAIAGGAGGVSSNTSYIESASGVGEGARTGLASIVTGVLFLLSTFFTPIVSAIPSEAAVPALVLVGFLMMQQVAQIAWSDLEIAIPAFLTIVLMPFTYSISVGIGAGFLAYVLIKLVLGKARVVHPLMWVVAASFAVYFAIDPLTDLLT